MKILRTVVKALFWLITLAVPGLHGPGCGGLEEVDDREWTKWRRQ